MLNTIQVFYPLNIIHANCHDFSVKVLLYYCLSRLQASYLLGVACPFRPCSRPAATHSPAQHMRRLDNNHAATIIPEVYINLYQSVGRRSIIYYRDGADQISRDPRTKRHKTRRKCLAKASKPYVSHSLISISLKALYSPPILRGSYAISGFVSSSSSSSSVNPLSRYWNESTRLMFSVKVSRVGGGVHGQQAIFSLLLPVCKELTG